MTVFFLGAGKLAHVMVQRGYLMIRIRSILIDMKRTALTLICAALALEPIHYNVAIRLDHMDGEEALLKYKDRDTAMILLVIKV